MNTIATSSLEATPFAPPTLLQQRLDVLPAMLEQLLIQTGKVLRDQDLNQPQYIAMAHRRVNDFVAPTNEKFQSVLNDIEIEIVHARAIIERDLAKMRKKRAISRQLDVEPSLFGGTQSPILSQTADTAGGALSSPVPLGEDVNSVVPVAKMDPDLPDSTMDIDSVPDMHQILESVNDEFPDLTLTGLKEAPVVTDAEFDALQLDSLSDVKAAPSTFSGEGTKLDTELDFDAMFGDAELGIGSTTDLSFELLDGAGLDFETNDKMAGTTDNENSLLAELDLAFEPTEIINADPKVLGTPKSPAELGATEDVASLLPEFESLGRTESSPDKGSTEVTTTLDFPPLPEVGDVTADAAGLAQGIAAQGSDLEAFDPANLDDIFDSTEFDIKLGVVADSIPPATAEGTADTNLMDNGFGDLDDLTDDWFKTL